MQRINSTCSSLTKICCTQSSQPFIELLIEIFSVSILQNFEPIAYPKKEYGKFYTGDSYIVLNVSREMLMTSTRLLFIIFFLVLRSDRHFNRISLFS